MARWLITALFWLPALPVGTGVKAFLLEWETGDAYILLFIYICLVSFSMCSDGPRLRNRLIEIFRL
jgi:hypothetical protein